ncbi:hypothetical protein [Nonomuraea sp. NEAU-A123]|uniref:hypothetical protein n=1 Tax=Nonomuraea sp. NEAU-A123 TaxID=2839649 RepID=UPI001BE4A710|nr:hypothetical protein [Nonomuraea sp. NEAU-A123]MBT2229322.1 hypothetical protein [Nonomuraea sp. NEAU-A123]
MLGSTIRNVVLAAAVVAAGVVGGAGVMSAPDGPGEDAKAFTDCVRAKGLPDFPEVVVSSDGLINLEIKGERVDVLSAKYGAAVKACEPLLPTGTQLPVAPSAPVAPVIVRRP